MSDPDIPQEPKIHEERPSTPQQDLPQCRICLDGEDPELGRLIRPCLCKGSVSYVHVKCLHQWRTLSSTMSAFYRCPNCGYHYRFARTKALGIASNPIVVGTLTGIAFTLLLFFSSFITTYLISGPTNESYFFYYPWDSVRDVIRTTVCVLTEGSCDDDALPGRLSKLRMPTPSGPPTLLGRFLRRLLLGLPTVGAGSMINIIYSMPFPIAHWIRVRLRRQNRNSTDFTALLVMTVILIGAAKALMQVYRLTEKGVQRLLLRAEDAIVEVSS